MAVELIYNAAYFVGVPSCSMTELPTPAVVTFFLKILYKMFLL